MPGSASFFLPDVGEIPVAGALATWMMMVLEYSQIFGELSILGAGLYMAGLRKSRARRYEAALSRNQYLVVAHGSEDEVPLATSPAEPVA